jgi:hypothetical protein
VEKKDFFISYTGQDRSWAVWIAWQLEEAGYSTIIQAWDFRPGCNFPIEMHQALQKTERMIAVCSEAYLESIFSAPEWASVFSQDPQGQENKLVPVKVSPCSPEGLLKAIVWINLIGLSEKDAKKVLLDGVKEGRGKPEHPPTFPEDRNITDKPEFPTTSNGRDIYIPQIKKPRTDLDISNFMEDSFQTISKHFSVASQALEKIYPHLKVKFKKIDETKFTCEVFQDGNHTAKCKIWIDDSYRTNNQICFSESYYSIEDNSYNESLGISRNSHDFSLEAHMRFGWDHQLQDYDLTNLSPQEAAEYLWKRFVRPLEH